MTDPSSNAASVSAPERRYTVEVGVDCDDADHLANVLRRIARDVEQENRVPTGRLSSEGYSVIMTRYAPDAPTGRDYDAALDAWWKDRKARRRASTAKAEDRDTPTA